MSAAAIKVYDAIRKKVRRRASSTRCRPAPTLRPSSIPRLRAQLDELFAKDKPNERSRHGAQAKKSVAL